MSTERETFAEKVQRMMGNEVPRWIPRGGEQGSGSDHVLIDLQSNFIDGKYPVKCGIKGSAGAEDIKYRKDAAHMDSSQVMCIGYFKKFFERSENEIFLLKILKESGIAVSETDNIKEAVFEYGAGNENTKFDFRLNLASGANIYFNVKYDESEFDDIDEKTAKEDYAVYLTPKANDFEGISNGRSMVEKLGNPHVLNLYWEKLVAKTLSVVADDEELKDYFEKFYEKYIWIFNEI